MYNKIAFNFIEHRIYVSSTNLLTSPRIIIIFNISKTQFEWQLMENSKYQRSIPGLSLLTFGRLFLLFIDKRFGGVDTLLLPSDQGKKYIHKFLYNDKLSKANFHKQ